MSAIRTAPLSRLALAALAVGAAAGAGACADPASGLHVEEIEGVTITAASTSTAGTCTASGVGKSAGVIDIDRGDCCGYTVGVEMINDLLTQTDPNTPPLTVDQHDITVNAVKASYQFIPDNGSPSVTLPEVTVPIGSTLLTSGGGSAIFLSTILPLETGAALSPAGGTPATGGLIATLTFEGTDSAGDAISAQPVDFPITVCAGCDLLGTSSGPLGCPSGDTIQACSPDSVDQDDGAICIAPLTGG